MNLKKLNKMIEEPASKEWFKKYGMPKAITNHPLKKKMAKKMSTKAEVQRDIDAEDLRKERSERGYGRRANY